MAGFASASEDDPIAGINITPLVDVVLVLLIIFLITAPVLYQSAIKVQLPRAATGEEAAKTPLSFTITREGKLSWGSDSVEWDALGARLSKLGPGVASETAVISADENTAHGVVIRLMDSLRQAGLTRFALNVESKSMPAASAPQAH